jgi:hypothetical protein
MGRGDESFSPKETNEIEQYFVTEEAPTGLL